jgi:hypothetical protein
MAFLTKAANRGSIATGYEIENSLKLEQDNSEYLKSTSAYAYTTPTSLTTGTFSCWVKRTEIGAGGYQASVFVSGSSARYAVLYFENDQIKIYSGDSSFNSTYPLTNAVFRDTSAWYHIVLRFDSTDSTAANRLRLYVNGEEQTWSTAPNITQNGHITFAAIGGPTWHAWGQNYGYFSPTNFFSGYLAEAQYIDGQALAPTEFGETDSDSGIWKPKEYDGTYGNAGYYLDFEDSSNLGNDVSGNGFDFDLTNITSADQATDTPTNNFCTLFPPPAAVGYGQEPSIKEGGTTMFNGAYATQNAFGTIGVRSGKWYFESTITNSGGIGTNNHGFGVIDPEEITYVTVAGGVDIGYFPAGWSCSSNSLPRNNDAAASGANATGALNENEIMGVALDMDNGKIWWHRQGTWTSLNNTVGNPVNGTEPAFSNLLTATDNFVVPAGGCYFNSGNEIRVMNFGGYAQAVFTAVGTYTDANGYGSFAYQPPSGYYALCSKNLARFG